MLVIPHYVVLAFLWIGGVAAADRFVAGQASAVVRWIEHGVPAPTATPPRLSDRGLGGRPTLVQNVETLAHLALIARYGAPWCRSVGPPAEPGSMLVTVVGAVREPRVLEIAVGTPVGQVLDLAGGPSAPLGRCCSAATSAPGWTRRRR